jgi:hypothetical protein
VCQEESLLLVVGRLQRVKTIYGHEDTLRQWTHSGVLSYAVSEKIWLLLIGRPQLIVSRECELAARVASAAAAEFPGVREA